MRLVHAHATGLLAMTMIPLIAVAGVIQAAIITGRYGDNEVTTYRCN